MTTAQNHLAFKVELVLSLPVVKTIASTLQGMLKQLVTFAFKNSAVVAAVSNCSAINSCKLVARKCVLTPNCVDSKLFYSAKARRSRRVVHVVTTSALIPATNWTLWSKRSGFC